MKAGSLLACILAASLAGPALAQDVEPTTPEPGELPPDPPSSDPAPDYGMDEQPQADLNQQAPSQMAPYGAQDGQWVYTDQYGWVWLPYGQAYTYVPPVGPPSVYLYGPGLGWRWSTAPWIFGWGPRPFWGPRGYGHFSWYVHPWFPSNQFHGQFHGHGAFVGPAHPHGGGWGGGGHPAGHGGGGGGGGHHH